MVKAGGLDELKARRQTADPAKVTCSALVNAASIAALVLTTESLVTEIPERPAPFAAPPGDV